MARLGLFMSVKDMPEVLAALQLRLADMLMEVAADEPPPVASRLREIAADFAAGQART